MAAETADVPRTDGQFITGKIKAWNLDKGFGFMTCDDGGKDLFIHQSEVAVEEKRFRAVAVGTPIRIVLSRDVGGRETGKACTKPDGGVLPGFVSRQQAAIGVTAGPNLGRVKFFSQEKGFGFIIPDDGSVEMFFNIANVENQTVLATDETISYDIKEIRGKPQAVDIKRLNPFPVAPAPAYYAPPPAGYPQYAPPPAGYAPPPAGYAPPPAAPQGYPAAAPYAAYPPSPSPPAGGTISIGLGVGAGVGNPFQGTIKFYDANKGFGFVTSLDGTRDTYFRQADVTAGTVGLTEGDVVSYDEKAAGGKNRAINIARARGAKRKAPSAASVPPMNILQAQPPVPDYAAYAAAPPHNGGGYKAARGGLSPPHHQHHLPPQQQQPDAYNSYPPAPYSQQSPYQGNALTQHPAPGYPQQAPPPQYNQPPPQQAPPQQQQYYQYQQQPY